MTTQARILVLSLCLMLPACAHQAVTSPPRSLQEVPPEQLFTRAKELAETGEYVPAEQYLQAARTRGYPEDLVVKELVKVCLSSSRYDCALDYAVPYLERNPEAWALRQVVATIYLAQGQGSAARIELSELLEQRPEDPDPHYLMAVVLRDEFKDSDSAASYFESYLGLAPSGDHAPEARAWIRRHSREREFHTIEVMP